MKIAIVILGYALAAYFFAAVWIPRIRLRWGIARSTTWLRTGTTRAGYRLPMMGTLSCLGTGTFAGAFTTFFIVAKNNTAATITIAFLLIGFVFGVIGRIRDTRANSDWQKH
jgi:hypothetical protein